MSILKQDYVDDVLNAEVNTRRKYNMIDNGDGTVSFEDVTDYSTNGDSFGGRDINDTNGIVNSIINSLVEETDLASASKAYNVGEYFVYNDGIYKVTVAINQGDAIVIDTNCELTDLPTELIAINNDLANKMDKNAINTTDTALVVRPDKSNPSIGLTAHLIGDTYNPRIALDYFNASGANTDNLSLTYDGNNFTLTGTKAGTSKTENIQLMKNGVVTASDMGFTNSVTNYGKSYIAKRNDIKGLYLKFKPNNWNTNTAYKICTLPPEYTAIYPVADQFLNVGSNNGLVIYYFYILNGNEVWVSTYTGLTPSTVWFEQYFMFI